MKTTFQLFLFAASVAAACAQDTTCANQSGECLVPAVVYEAPVVYAAPVVYEAPVVYHSAVYYGISPDSMPCQSDYVCSDAAASTVVYIGGGRVASSEARCNSGSTLTIIGRQSRFH